MLWRETNPGPLEANHPFVLSWRWAGSLADYLGVGTGVLELTTWNYTHGVMVGLRWRAVEPEIDADDVRYWTDWMRRIGVGGKSDPDNSGTNWYVRDDALLAVLCAAEAWLKYRASGIVTRRMTTPGGIGREATIPLDLRDWQVPA